MHAREYQKGILFPVHSYWFSLLLLPFYLIAGLPGIYFFLASLLAVSIYLINKIMCFLLAPNKQYLAYGSSLAFAFIVPFARSSITIYPSVPGTVLVLLSLYFYCQFLKTDKSAYLGYSLLTIATLEFLHHTYLIISVVWVIYLVLNHYNRLSKRDFLAVALVYLLWIVTPYFFGGDIFVGSQKGNFINPQTFFNKFSYHSFNLEVGLISNSPVYALLVIIPIILIVLRKRVNLLSIKALQLSYVSLVCFYSFVCLHQITPGESPIARYFVPVLPLVFISIVYAISLSRFTELLFGILLAYSFLIGIVIFDTRCNVLSCHSWIVERLQEWTGSQLVFQISYFDDYQLAGIFIFSGFLATLVVNQLFLSAKNFLNYQQ